MGTVTPIRDRIEARKGEVIELRRQPRWLERRMAESKGNRFVAVKDTSEWRPEPAA
jgi:hypothetical protein